jgi:hypothetical protein
LGFGSADLNSEFYLIVFVPIRNPLSPRSQGSKKLSKLGVIIGDSFILLPLHEHNVCHSCFGFLTL